MSLTPSLRSRASDCIGGSWRLSSFELSLSHTEQHGWEFQAESVLTDADGIESSEASGWDDAVTSVRPPVRQGLRRAPATQPDLARSTHHLQKVLC